MIEVRECSKSFGNVKAVNKATLDIGDREVFGLVGSNGAGKSTLLRMMAGIIRPDEGEIQIDGLPLYENDDLGMVLKNIKKFKPKKFKSNTDNMIELICNYIDNN